MEPTDADIKLSLGIQAAEQLHCPQTYPDRSLGLRFASVQRQFVPVDLPGRGFQPPICPSDNGMCLDTVDNPLGWHEKSKVRKKCL